MNSTANVAKNSETPLSAHNQNNQIYSKFHFNFFLKEGSVLFFYYICKRIEIILLMCSMADKTDSARVLKYNAELQPLSDYIQASYSESTACVFRSVISVPPTEVDATPQSKKISSGKRR